MTLGQDGVKVCGSFWVENLNIMRGKGIERRHLSHIVIFK